ncbi:MAG: type III pantothenate kinase [Anaerolineae bacterium]|nr:type III pantothenate kinase [Anaerolineae bacterium]
MLLAVDIGNTNITLGLWHNNEWVASWRARTVPDKMPDEYGVLVNSFLSSQNFDYRSVSSVVISSVVPALTPTFLELSHRYIEVEPIVVTHRTKMGIRIEIDQPEQAGADRLVNAAAVTALYQCNAIVVDFGTATNFDIVSAEGAYCGGAIAPGIGLAHDALVARAAKLHKIDLLPPPNPIGRNTIHAMQSGIFWGYAALVEGMISRLKAAMRDAEMGDNIRVIATGGLAPLFRQHTNAIDQIDPDLTLEGLRVIYQINASA